MRAIHINSILFAAFLLILAACKKKDQFMPDGTLETAEYIYNEAIKGFQPEATVEGTVAANFDIRTIYYYLQRNNTTDSLLQTDFVEAGSGNNYTFSLDPAVWNGVKFENVKGLKVLFVRDNTTSIEKFISITYFNPAAPQFSELPETVTPSLNGSTAITGKLSSETGIQKLYFSDNSTGNMELIDSIAVNGAKDYTINYPYTYKEGAGQMRVHATDIYGLVSEKLIQFVGIPFRPVLTFSNPVLKAALPHGTPIVSGAVKTFGELVALKAYVVKTSGETLVGDVSYALTGSAPNEYNYTFSLADFPFADDVTECRIEAMDANNSNSSANNPVQILPYYHWKNVTMMAQGLPNADPPLTSSSSFFIGEVNKPVIGSCDVNGNTTYDDKIDFVAYTTTAPAITFYNPNNTGSIRGNYRCNGGATGWTPATVRDVRMRVMLQTSVSNGSNIYTKYNAGGIESLGNDFFSGVSTPSANTAKYDNVSTPASNVFHPDNAYLVWMKTPEGKNILVHVKDTDMYTSPNQGRSTVVLDILKER